MSVHAPSDLSALALPEDALFINGAWAPSGDGRTADVQSPATGEAIGRVTLAGVKDIQNAVDHARRAFDDGDWAHRPVAQRADVLRRLADALDEHAEAFRWLHALEGGTPISSSVANQAPGSATTLRYYADLATTFPWVEERAGATAIAEVRHTPVGVVAAIVPWNAPLSLTMNKLAPALLAGCTVIVKPAEETPLHALLLARLIEQLELPAGVVSILPAERDVSQALVEAPQVDKVTFTGGTLAGRKIAELCATQLKRCSLELGGKSAAVILPDADLPATVARVAPLTMINNGQICINQTRVLAPKERCDEVLALLSDRITRFKVGDPLDPTTEIGPLISAAQRQRVQAAVEYAQSEGARVVTGGTTPAHLTRGWYFEPTVLSTADPQSAAAQQEIFGPVVTVIPYDDEDDAVRIANNTPYGLSGTVWGRDLDRAHAVATRIRTGNIGLGTLSLDVVAPFGGFKQSGLGREKGPEGLAAYTELQTVMRPPAAGA